MALHTVDMIRRLASGVRPDGGRVKKGDRPFESRSFAELLGDTSRDVRPSGRPVHVAPDVELELEDEQEERLAFALDRAEARFVERLMAVTSQGVMVLDVLTRTVRSVDENPDDEVMAGIDGAVVLGGLGNNENERGPSSEELARGLRRVGSASLVRVLAQGEGAENTTRRT